MSFGASFSGAAGMGGQHSESSRPRKQQRAAQKHVLSQGTAITIHGLVKAPQHNGRTGHIVGWDSVKARYEVQLRFNLGDGDNLCLRPESITQHCSVEVTGLINKSELNGCSGEIFTYDDLTHRYVVIVGGESLSIQPANCILDPGTCVVINYPSRPKCNGQQACIIDIDRAASCYTVQCEDWKQMGIKYEKVLC